MDVLHEERNLLSRRIHPIRVGLEHTRVIWDLKKGGSAFIPGLKTGVFPLRPLHHHKINTADPIPLYLVPQAVGAAVRRFGRHILEIWVSNAPGHTYTVTVRTQEEGDA